MKKPLKIILYSVLGLIGIVFLTFLPGIILGLFMISGGCGDEILQTVPLEKGKIELHQENCGATTDFTYDLRWKTTNKKSKSFTSLELSYGEPYFKILEETKNKIVISYSPGTKLEDTHVKINQKDVYFKRRTVKIDKPTDFLSMKRSLKGLDFNFYINNISIYKHPESLENQTEFAIDDKGFKNDEYDSTWYPIGFINANNNEISSTLFVHTNEKNYPVYMDIESKKKTKKVKIASSYQNFEQIVSLIKETGYGKDYCNNPAKDKKLEEKRTEILTIFKQENPDSSSYPWETFIPAKPYKKNEACQF